MNNEEKILDLLGQVIGRLDRLEATQARQGEQMAEMQTTQAKQGEQLNRLEERLEELDARSLKSAVLLETDIPHQLGVLFEGHKNILDTLAPKERVEKVERTVAEKVVVLEAVVKSHSDRLAVLEKAQ